jgi:hypothetical protein
MTWRQIDCWKEAADRLEIEISGPTEILLASGSSVHAELFVRYFGAPKGTLVFDGFPAVSDHEFFQSGYTYSVIERPEPGVCFSIEDLKDLLRDWGWCGPDDGRPTWLDTFPE